jgi:hypothetical protein
MFQHRVHEGQPVIFYVGDNKDTGEIVDIEGNIVTIQAVDGQHKVLKSDIYPLLGFDYDYKC